LQGLPDVQPKLYGKAAEWQTVRDVPKDSRFLALTLALTACQANPVWRKVLTAL